MMELVFNQEVMLLYLCILSYPILSYPILSYPILLCVCFLFYPETNLFDLPVDHVFEESKGMVGNG